MAKLCACGRRWLASVTTFSASLIHQHDIAEWTQKERGAEGQETKAPSLFLEHLSMPCPTLWIMRETCKEENSSLQSAQVSRECCCPLSRKQKLKALTGKSIVNFDPRSWHSPASNMFNNTSEKCATSSGGRLGCSKSLKAIESNFNNLTSQCSKKFFSQIQLDRKQS